MFEKYFTLGIRGIAPFMGDNNLIEVTDWWFNGLRRGFWI
jgi:hypothetical protein